MKIKELTNWMRETFEQGNGVIAVSAGQGGSGAELVMKELGETLIADVAMYDDTEISIVEDATEIEEVGIMIDHLDQLSNYDAVVKLANDEGQVLYILYYNDENPTDITLTKGSYGHDLLEWSYMGKQYKCEGEFKVTERGNLHHTFIAPNGKEMEIVVNYYPESDQ